ncbi:unnamed protein product [Pedinophyceae sp. YPF-701]|nr:unnamed protein product [Pedinophyceae sp. YPF-701]
MSTEQDAAGGPPNGSAAINEQTQLAPPAPTPLPAQPASYGTLADVPDQQISVYASTGALASQGTACHAPGPRAGSQGKDVKYDSAFIAKVARAYEHLKTRPDREGICGDRNPAQVVGEEFGVSEWTVYRHYKRAVAENLIEKQGNGKRFRSGAVSEERSTRRASEGRWVQSEMTRDIPPVHRGGPGRPQVHVSVIQGKPIEGSSFAVRYVVPGAHAAVALPGAGGEELAAGSAFLALPGEYNVWCTLPGVGSSEHMELRCHEYGFVLVMVNPAGREVPDAEWFRRPEVVAQARKHIGTLRISDEDLKQPFETKIALQFPTPLRPATAVAKITGNGAMFFSVSKK